MQQQQQQPQTSRLAGGQSQSQSQVSRVPAIRMTPRPQPGTRPACCALNPVRQCPNTVKWRIDDGYYCGKHAERFWESHFVDEHRVLRLMTDEWKGKREEEATPQIDLAAIA